MPTHENPLMSDHASNALPSEPDLWQRPLAELGGEHFTIYTDEHPDGERVSAAAVRGAITRLIGAYLNSNQGPAARRIARLAELELTLLLGEINGTKP